MTQARIVSLEVRGFRAFGTDIARFELDAPVTVVHGANSQGKTSLAEAIEFLISGRSSRRDLLGGAKAEYNDSLRNAHLTGGEQVYVEAVVRVADGSLHTARRNLTGDFGRGAECDSDLLIDGDEAEGLSSIGLSLADPPVSAPVLLQHILRHALSTEPKQRVAYFKSLLSLSDLDLLRERVAEGRKRLEQEPDGYWLQQVATLPEELVDLQNRLSSIARTAESPSDLDAIISDALRDAAEIVTGDSYVSLADAKVALESRVSAKSEAVFPIAGLRAQPISTLDLVAPDTRQYAEVLSAVDVEVARLQPILAAVLQVDEFAAVTAPVDCPVCATPEALTPARIEVLRAELASAKNLDQIAAETLAAIDRAQDALTVVTRYITTGVPQAADAPESEISPLATKLDSWGLDADLVRDSYASARSIAADIRSLTPDTQAASEALIALRSAVQRRQPLPKVAPDFADLDSKLHSLRQKHQAYAVTISALEQAVAPVITQRAEITDQRQLLRLFDAVTGLGEDLTRAAQRDRALTRVRSAEKELQKASVALLDARFTEMSETIKAWWLTIRPEELVDFHGVKSKASGNRFVNLIAALHTEAGTTPVERDALGVYSDSQLNALGLSIFLARAELLGSPIIVLDDPIPGSDPDHRLTFVQNTLTKLLDAGVQVILTTYDGKLANWSKSYHDHRGLMSYELNLASPKAGTVPTQTSDVFSQLMLDAEDNLNAPTARGRRAACGSYRSAAERLAKQIIATARTESGTPCSVADVETEASVLGQLVPLVRGFSLSNDEKGKWNTFSTVLNPGNHDDDVPSTTELKVMRGNLRAIAKSHRAHWANGLVA